MYTRSMSEIFTFVIENWFLSGVFLMLLAVLIIGELQAGDGGVPKLMPQEIVRALNQQQAVVLDLRSKLTFSQGAIVNSINIPQETLVTKLDTLKPYKEKIVILVGLTQADMQKAGKVLKQNQFTNVMQLKGGIRGWQNAELPLTMPNKTQKSKKHRNKHIHKQ